MVEIYIRCGFKHSLLNTNKEVGNLIQHAYIKKSFVAC